MESSHNLLKTLCLLSVLTGSFGCDMGSDSNKVSSRFRPEGLSKSESIDDDDHKENSLMI